MLYFTMILIGLHYLHSKGIIHNNLNTANIYIDRFSVEVDSILIGGFSKSRIKDNLMFKSGDPAKPEKMSKS